MERTIAEVHQMMAEIGIPIRGLNTSFFCPICNGGRKHEKSASINTETGLGQCFRASCEFKFNIDKLYKTMLSRDFDTPENLPDVAAIPQNPLADIKVRDRNYRIIRNNAKLLQKHIDNLLKRGLKSDEILSLGYFSTDWDYKKAQKITSEQISSPEGTPGFFQNKKGAYTFKTPSASSIVMPMLNEFGQIQGLHLRKDDEFVEDGKKKCSYFSSNGASGGTKANGFIHFACDFENGKAIIQNNTLYLTEGVMKADIAHKVSGLSFVAVPGVDVLNEFKSYLSSGRFKELGVKTIVLCYDMDLLENKGVLKACAKTKKLIEEAGLDFKQMFWDETYKGIDDFLVAKLR